MKKIWKWLAVSLAAVMMVTMAVPAAAEEAAAADATEGTEEAETSTFTSSDGVLSIELPDESWKEIREPSHWIVLSDGANMIVIDHFSNGEKLPDIAIADEHYVNVYEAVFSTQNEVFIINGYTVDAEKIPEICQMIMSVKVLKYDTKMAVNKKDNNAGEFSIQPVNRIMYTTEGINVRNGYSTSDSIIGGLAKGAGVNVLGKVMRNGQDYGWYQIEFNGGVGYVFSGFITETAPAQEVPAITFTGAARTIYDDAGNAVTVYEATDSFWYDGAGSKYTQISDYQFSGNGITYSINQPIPEENDTLTPTGPTFSAYWENGDAVALTPYSDGCYYSDSWVQYWDNGNGTYSGSDGSTLYYEPLPQNDSRVIALYSQGSGRPVVITDTGNGFFDAEGNQYYEQADGTFVDDYGAIYDYEYHPDDPV